MLIFTSNNAASFTLAIVIHIHEMLAFVSLKNET